MSWFTDLIDRIDAKLDKPADQSVLTDRRRRSIRMIDRMKRDEERAARGEAPPIEQGKVRGGAAEKNSRQRWFGR